MRVGVLGHGGTQLADQPAIAAHAPTAAACRRIAEILGSLVK
ncbi:hypothetical protein [Nonomuraea sp. NPDC005501]